MSPVEFTKKPCRPVEFKGQGPLDSMWDAAAGPGSILPTPSLCQTDTDERYCFVDPRPIKMNQMVRP